MARNITRKPLRKQRGADIVEFVISLPIMMIVFFLILGFGVVMCDWAVVASASRAATREAIRNPSNEDVWDATDNVLASLLTWTGTNPYRCDRLCTARSNCAISPCTRTPTIISGATTTPQSPRAGSDVVVTVKYPFSFTIPWLYTLTIRLASATHMSNLPQ